MIEAMNLTVGLIWHSEPEEILLRCLGTLNLALTEAGEQAELILVRTDWERRTKNRTESLAAARSAPDLEALRANLKNFKSIQFIPASADQNSIGLKRNLILQQTKTELLYFTDPDVQHDQLLFVDFKGAMRISIQCRIENIKKAELKNTSAEQSRCLGFTGPYEHQSSNPFLQAQIDLLTYSSARLRLAYQGVNFGFDRWVDHAPMGHALFYVDRLRELGGISPYFDRVGEDLDVTHRASAKGLQFLYCSARTTHHLPGFLKSLEKFFHYGRAQILVQSRNGVSHIRWYRLIPLAVAFPIFLSIYYLVSAFQLETLGASELILAVLATFFLVGLHISVLGAYFWGMVFEIICPRRQKQNEPVPKTSLK